MTSPLSFSRPPPRSAKTKPLGAEGIFPGNAPEYGRWVSGGHPPPPVLVGMTTEPPALASSRSPCHPSQSCSCQRMVPECGEKLITVSSNACQGRNSRPAPNSRCSLGRRAAERTTHFHPPPPGRSPRWRTRRRRRSTQCGGPPRSRSGWHCATAAPSACSACDPAHGVLCRPGWGRGGPRWLQM